MITHDNSSIRFPDDFFEYAFNYYSSGLLVYAKHYVAIYGIAEDIVHDVFLNFWEKRNNIERGKIKSYLFTATRNGCLNYLSHLKVRTKFQNEILNGGTLPNSFDEDFYIPIELMAIIESAIDRLPPQRKKVFMMHRFGKKTIAEIAKSLEIAPKTVDKHLELALKELRGYLSDYLYVLLMFFSYRF